VFGDDGHVYVVETVGDNGPTTVKALRAQDGVAVPVPDFGKLYARRVRTLGRCLLLAEDDAQGAKVLRLYDVQSGQDVWRRAFVPGALVVRSEDPGVTGVVEKDRAVTLLDARSGRELLQAVIQPDHADKLREVAVLTDRDHFYLALSRTPENGLNWNPNVSSGIRSLRVNGPLYALDRSTGQLAWVCDFLPHQMLLLEQVQDLPLLMFASQYYKTGANGNYEQRAVKVTAVDKRTGKLVYDQEFTPHTPFHALKTDPQAGVIELVRSDRKISFRLEAVPAAPTPPHGVATGPVTAGPVTR